MTESPIVQAAAKYLDDGLPIVPIPPINGRPVKGPRKRGWQKSALRKGSDLSILRANWNIGLLLEELTDIDADLPALRNVVRRRLPETRFRYGHLSNPESHYVYRIPGNQNKKFEAPPMTGLIEPGLIEIRHGGQQSVLPPSIHEQSGEVYEFTNGSAPKPADWTAEECLVTVSAIAALGLLSLCWKKGIRFYASTALAGAMARNGWTRERAAPFFFDLAELTGDQKLIYRVGKTYERFSSNDPIVGIPSLRDLFGAAVTSKLVEWLELDGQAAERWIENRQKETYQAAVAPPDESLPVNPPSASLLNQDLNDTGNSERLIAVHGENLLFVHKWKKWLVWDGRRWLKDEKDKFRALTRHALKTFAKEAIESNNDTLVRFALKSMNNRPISSAIHEACDQRAVLVEELDSDRDLLNFTNGTFNLKTGKLVNPHNRDDRITKLVHCDYEPAANCLVFLNFLNQVVGAEQVPILIRALAYTLTGHTSEKCTFVCWGPTNSGKTTLLDLLSEYIFKEYSALIRADSLMQRPGHQDANTLSDLADLCGARFVQSSETREGQQLDEATLKRITPGQGLIRAVRKYENPFTFSPTHKLWIDTNHSIVATGTGDDLWGRIVPFEFGPRIPDDKIDRTLPSKLQKEVKGIFALLCAEAKVWYEQGLGKLPEKMLETRQDWKNDADRVKRFIEEWCDLGKKHAVLARPLYQANQLWDREANERPMTETMFGRKLKELMTQFNISKKPTAIGVNYEGLKLNARADYRLVRSTYSPDRPPPRDD